MAEVEYLEWEVSKNKDWITVYPESGVGNTQVSINVQPTQIVGDTDTAGTVTFTCKSCSPQLLKQVSVTRCAPTECVPESRSTVYADTAVTANACDNSVSVSLTYSEITKYRGGAAVNCPDKIINSSMVASFVIPTNDTNVPVTYTRYYPDVNTQGHATITISQSAGPCSCVDYDVSASTTSLSCGGGNISFKAVRGSSPSRNVKERWVNTDGYICVGNDKYNRIKKQISTDNGVTWIDEGSVAAGDVLLEKNSADCGYVPPTPPTPPTPGIYKAKMVVNNTTYTVDCNDSTVLTSGDMKSVYSEYSSMTSVEIGSCVTEMGNDALGKCGNLVSLTIPDGVKTINDYAFYECSNLTSLSIGSGTTSIKSNSFNKCKSLKYITVNANNTKFDSRNNCNAIIETATNTLIHGSETTIIPNNITKIDSLAFHYLKNLTNITIPNSVTTIGEHAFGYCSGLTSVTIGNSVTTIANHAFTSCEGLTSINIPNSVTSIGHDAFSECHNLENINIPNSVTNIGYFAFSNCYNLRTVTIGTGITAIDSDTFNKCRNLTSVTIPSVVTSIGVNAFNGCSGLTSIIVEATNPPTVKSSSFKDTNNCPIYVPRASVDLYQQEPDWSVYSDRIRPIA